MSGKNLRFVCNNNSFRPCDHLGVRWLEWNTDYLMFKELRKDVDNFEYTQELWEKAEISGYRFCAYIKDEKILSLAGVIRWSVDAKSWEVGAVQTRVETRNLGYAKKVVSFVTSYILDNGKFATCNTQEDNVAMQKVAESIGFFRYD